MAPSITAVEKSVGGNVPGSVFNLHDVHSQEGLLMPSNWFSEGNMLTFAVFTVQGFALVIMLIQALYIWRY